MLARSVRAAALTLLVGCGGQSRSLTDRSSRSAEGGGSGNAESGAAGTANGGAGGAGTAGPCSLTMHGDVRLEHQSDVEALRDASLLDGSLYVTGDVSDLSALECLSAITHDFQVAEARELVSLDGLEHLTTVGGAVTIGAGCDWALAECVGNPLLRSIDALSGLASARDVYITSGCARDDGTDPCTVSAVLERAVFQHLATAHSVRVNDNPALTEARFDRVQSIDDFSLGWNAALTTATFASLKNVNEFFFIGENPELLSLAGFSELTDVPTVINIFSSNFTSLTGLENLRSTQALQLQDDPLLTDLSSLSNLNDLAYVSVIGTGIKSLHGLERLTSLATLTLTDNPALASLDGVNNVQQLQTLELADLPALQDLETLASLSFASSVTVRSCPLLPDLGALSRLTDLERLEISDNAALPTLEGLNALTRAGTITIAENAALKTLRALGAVESITGYGLTITGNPSLPACEVERLVDRIGAENIAGTPAIAGNDDAGICEP